MEEQWIVDRARLRELLHQNPGWSVTQLQEAVGRSERWVRKWKQRLQDTALDDDQALQSQSRQRHTPPAKTPEPVVAAILELRDTLPERIHRVAGPKLILYYLHQREDLKAQGYRLPRSTTTIWKILDQHQRIIRPHAAPEHEPMERPDPMQVWELDFTDVPGIAPDPDGKQQHMVEMLNIVDRGTSILVETTARTDFNQETALLSVANTFLCEGLPAVLVIDRDPRLVGSWSAEGYPCAFMRFVLSLGVKVEVCPARRPDLKPFVERVHRTIKAECIRQHAPETVDHTQTVIDAYQDFYNTDRPHQGLSCNNQPPYVAFPVLPPRPRLPDMVDPDRWLLSFHQRHFKRRVRSNGTVTVDKHDYYLGRRFAGQYAVLKLDAHRQHFSCEINRQPVKTVPIKGLIGEPMEFDPYLEMMFEAARSEWQRLLRKRKRRVA